MDKSEAAAYLGISTRTLERYTQQGKLQVKYEGAKTRPIASYNPEDLDRLKAELETPVIGGNAEFGQICTLRISSVRKGSMTCPRMCQQMLERTLN